MHAEVLEYVSQYASDRRLQVLDIGGRDVNGTPRHLFPHARYTSVDALAGRGVDLVGDVMAIDLPLGYYDVVLCLEVFEHCHYWREVVARAARLVRPGGRVVFTCAAEGRSTHSGVDGGPRLHQGEWYRNLRTWDLHDAMITAGLDKIHLVCESCDLRASAVRRIPVVR